MRTVKTFNEDNRPEGYQLCLIMRWLFFIFGILSGSKAERIESWFLVAVGLSIFRNTLLTLKLFIFHGLLTGFYYNIKVYSAILLFLSAPASLRMSFIGNMIFALRALLRQFLPR